MKEIARGLREDCIGMKDCKPGNAHEFCFTCQAADTIEALGRKNERLAKIEHLVWLNTGVTPPGSYSAAVRVLEKIRRILEGDPLQGGSDK